MFVIKFEYHNFKITIIEKNNKIAQVLIGENQFVEKTTALLLKAKQQMLEYFMHKRKKFDLPLLLEGTSFQIKVWEALQNTTYGKTYSYQEIAQKISNKNYARAVGNANNKNPLPIIIPCHRIVAKNGVIGGYKYEIAFKQLLIHLEKSKIV